jgi:hypothetical protein
MPRRSAVGGIPSSVSTRTPPRPQSVRRRWDGRYVVSMSSSLVWPMPRRITLWRLAMVTMWLVVGDVSAGAARTALTSASARATVAKSVIPRLSGGSPEFESELSAVLSGSQGVEALPLTAVIPDLDGRVLVELPGDLLQQPQPLRARLEPFSPRPGDVAERRPGIDRVTRLSRHKVDTEGASLCRLRGSTRHWREDVDCSVVARPPRMVALPGSLIVAPAAASLPFTALVSARFPCGGAG